MRKLDAIDRELLRLLQENADTPMAKLAEAVNLSQTPCWRRIQKLKEDGVITRQVALLDPAKLNLGITVFAAVRTNQHSEAWFRKFHSAVAAIPPCRNPGAP
jgi:Lrp/AsnC family transcriptional regulator